MMLRILNLTCDSAIGTLLSYELGQYYYHFVLIFGTVVPSILTSRLAVKFRDNRDAILKIESRECLD